jgi:hypothetical protein
MPCVATRTSCFCPCSLNHEARGGRATESRGNHRETGLRRLSGQQNRRLPDETDSLGSWASTYPQQGQLLYDALKPLLSADKMTHALLQGAGHGDPQFTAPADMKVALDFLAKYLKG